MKIETNMLELQSKRKYLHFVKEYKSVLFTIQEDTLLTLWKIESPFQLKKIKTLPLEGRFYEPNFQFVDDTLLLSVKRGNRLAIVNFQDLENPTVVTQERKIGSIKGSCIAKGKLYIQLSSIGTKEYSFEVSDIPTVENRYPTSKLVIPDEEADTSAFYSLVVNDTIYWINQDSIFVMDISIPDEPKPIVTKEIVDLGIGYPIMLPNNRMIVFEIAGDVRIGLNYLDISNNNVKRKAKGILKNHCIRGWQLVGNELYIVHLDFKKINNERKYKTYLSKIDVTDAPVINNTIELSIIEEYGDDSSTIVWYSIRENNHVFLQGTGVKHELPVESS